MNYTEARLISLCEARGLRYSFDFLCDLCGNRFYELYIFDKGYDTDVYVSDRSAELDECELRAQVIRRAIRGIEKEIE